jgi:hypothetical protein
MASRYYALVSVAQLDAVVEASRGLHKGSNRPSSIESAVAAAASGVLAFAYPDRTEWLAEQTTLFEGKDDAASRLGRAVAQRVIAEAASDGSDITTGVDIPTGAGLWFSTATPPMPPLRPRWGQVRPWYLSKGSEFRPEPPPAFGSSAYQRDLAEVRRISDQRSNDQLRLAQFWADGVGTATPPGHWNQIAAELIADYHLDERKAAMTFALLNTAVMDAGISCWDAKYHYWLIRPPQADPAITTPVGLPNFPSYVSGHATFSGAASEVLSAIFPARRERLRAMAEEAALSRLYAGIHYRFDNDVGLRMGRSIGALALRRWTESHDARQGFLPARP